MIPGIPRGIERLESETSNMERVQASVIPPSSRALPGSLISGSQTTKPDYDDVLTKVSHEAFRSLPHEFDRRLIDEAGFRDAISQREPREFLAAPSSLVAHAPIFIDGDREFARQAALERWEGSGREGDPYIIESLLIEATDSHLIHIQHTTVWFEIRNCRLDGRNHAHNGIYLLSLPYATLRGNVIQNSKVGIALETVRASSVLKNTVTDF